METTPLLYGLLGSVLSVAVVTDIRSHKIPNWLTLPAIGIGLLIHAWLNGVPGVLWALGGVLVSGLMLPWRALGWGGGDVKLLAGVGALMGPIFALWTLLGAALAGGLLALGVLVKRGVVQARFNGQSVHAGRMPYAPAIALGAVFAWWRLHGGW